MRAKLAIFFLLPALVCAADSHRNNGKNPPRSRGTQAGSYTVTLAGHFTGTGTATVDTAVAFTANVTTTSGATGTFSASNLTLTNGYFKGTGAILGLTCTLQGRADLPSATDPDQTNLQAITGRITGTFKDSAGNVGRFVAVQNDPTPQNGGDNGNGKDNGGGNDGPDSDIAKPSNPQKNHNKK